MSFEGLIGAVFNAFRYDSPKLNAAVSSQLYPSFSIQGRVRWQNDLRLSYELVKDFMVTVTVFSAPQNVTIEELRIESYFPLDDATTHACERLARD